MPTIPGAHDPREQYSIISVKNIDTKDFVFSVDKAQYMIGAGETRNFPRFMARLAIKHLIDKLANDEDEEGKLIKDKNWRNKQAAKIVVGEQEYEKPEVPTDDEIVEEINQSDLDSVLAKNKKSLKSSKPIIEPPPVDIEKLETPKPKEAPKKLKKRAKITEDKTKKKEKFAGLEPKKLPSREEMLKYAEDTLKMDLSDEKTMKAFKKLSSKELYEELQMEA